MEFKPRWPYQHQHISTIVPSLFRKRTLCEFDRLEFSTADGDFVHIDQLLDQNHNKAVILLHGLEGSSQEHYIQSLALEFFKNGFNVYAFNFRSCSGVMNKTSHLYHSGQTSDLNEFIQWLEFNKNYKSMALVGFSLGGNVSLKYFGEKKSNLSDQLKCVVGISVPMDLRGCSYRLASGVNRIYSLHFMLSLRKKVKFLKKSHKLKSLDKVRPSKLLTFIDFDHLVTAPLHGFKSNEDYWLKSSSLQFLKDIDRPSLIINAKNDPFLSPECFPTTQELNNSNITTLYPSYGGHVGFIEHKLNEHSYAERKTIDFVLKHCV